MGHYYSATAKRHICWANSKKIGRLNKGVLTKQQRKSISDSGVRSARKGVSKSGKPNYTGTSDLKGTGI